MVTPVQGADLQPLVGQAQPRHVIPGPGKGALKMVAGTDQSTYLVSPGVLDCAILTIFLLPHMALPQHVASFPVAIGRHRAAGARAMAHYNDFSGPSLQEIKSLFNAFLAGHAVTANDLTVAISYHRGANRPYTKSLVSKVGRAALGLNLLTLHGYGNPPAPGERLTKAITVYLSPSGQLSASQ